MTSTGEIDGDPLARVTTVIIPELPFSLDPDGSPPCRHVVEGGALTLTAAAGTDMFIDPSGAEPAPDAGRLTGEPPRGDFTLTARTTVRFANTFDAGVLLAFHASGSQPPQARIGFLAQSPTGPGCTATFDNIALRAGTHANLRDGS